MISQSEASNPLWYPFNTMAEAHAHSSATVSWLLHARPRIHVAGRFALADRRFERTYSGHPYALHVYGYHGRMQLDERMLHLAPGDITLTAHGHAVRYDLPKPGHHLCVHFGAEPDGSAVAATPPTVALPVHVPADPAAEGPTYADALQDVIRLHTLAQARPEAAVAASAALQRLLLVLALQTPALGDAPAAIGMTCADRAALLLRERLAEPLDVPALARAVGRSQNYLARQFKMRFGVTMPRYLLDRRMDYAALLLRTTDLPIGEVGRRAGLPDPRHFNKQFRAALGMSPSAYRVAADQKSRSVAR